MYLEACVRSISYSILRQECLLRLIVNQNWILFWKSSLKLLDVRCLLETYTFISREGVAGSFQSTKLTKINLNVDSQKALWLHNVAVRALTLLIEKNSPALVCTLSFWNKHQDVKCVWWLFNEIGASENWIWKFCLCSGILLEMSNLGAVACMCCFDSWWRKYLLNVGFMRPVCFLIYLCALWLSGAFVEMYKEWIMPVSKYNFRWMMFYSRSWFWIDSFFWTIVDCDAKSSLARRASDKVVV